MKFVTLNYQPDFDCGWEQSPGALLDCGNMIPRRRRSYATWTAHVDNGKIADYTRTTYPVTACIVRLPNNTVRWFAFERQAIYELTSTSAATDRSKGGGYSASTLTWTWTMFGNTCIAVNKEDNPQSSASGAFADLAGSPPKAQFVVSQLGFVMLLNYNDGTDTPDGWWCSQLENPTGSWTPSNSTQAANGRLYDTPGPITAACALRDSIVVFKADSIYVGDYIGDTTNGIIWGWRLISDKIGCSAPHGVALLNDKLYFVHRSNVYEFDGAAARPIGMPVINTLVNDLMISSSSLTRMYAVVDQREGLVFWFYSSSGSNDVIDYALAYNVYTGQFGTVTNAAVKSTGTEGTDYFATCAVKTTQADLVTFLSSTGDPSTIVLMGKPNTTKTAAWLGAYPGAANEYDATRGSAFIDTGPIGNGDDGLRMDRIKPRWYRYVAADQAATPQGTLYGSKLESQLILDSGYSHTVGATWNSTELSLDGVIQDRYLKATINIGGPAEIAGLYLNAKLSAKL